MNGTALAVIQKEELDTIQRAAKLLAVSGYFDGKGDNPQAIAMLAAKIMAGREMGFGPFASANGVHIIQGRPSIGANLMASAVKGNRRYDYRVKELTSERCAIEFFERDGEKKTSIGVSEFTMDDAKAMQLTGKDNWKKSPRNMLFARALSNGVRWFAPDVFSGNAVYVPEELGADVDSDGEIIDVTPRRVDQATGEIVEEDFGMGQPRTHNAPTPSQTPQDSDEGNNGHNAHLAPLYASLIDKLTGDCLERANRARKIHAQSRGAATPEQYRFLAGTIDDIVRQTGGHKAVLEVFVGRAVSSANPPGIQLANKLLDALVEFKTEEQEGVKVKVPNPDYKPEAVACVHAIWPLVREVDGQAKLFDTESQQSVKEAA